MSFDAITKDDIIKQFQTQCDEFDDYEAQVDNVIRTKNDNAQKLRKFVIVKPYEISAQIAVGDYLRFIKRKMFKLSCICVVKEVVYKSGSNKNVEKLILSPIKYDNTFVIYPYNHYIYKKDMTVFDQTKKQKLEEMYEKNKNVKIVNISQETKLKLSDNYFGKKYGSGLDLKINEIIEKNEKMRNVVDDDELENGMYVDKLIKNTELRKVTLKKISNIKKKEKTQKTQKSDN